MFSCVFVCFSHSNANLLLVDRRNKLRSLRRGQAMAFHQKCRTLLQDKSSFLSFLKKAQDIQRYEFLGAPFIEQALIEVYVAMIVMCVGIDESCLHNTDACT